MHPPISVVMRSMNDGPLIAATLKAVYDQDYPGVVELIHIDSGSKDNTVEAIQSTKPHKLIQILPREYVPGVVLNRGMRESQGDWVVFLNSDAEPANRQWLSEMLAAARSQPRVGTAFSRQIPRPDCQAVYAHDYDRCFGPNRESATWEHFFSMVSCIVSRRAWEEEAFREDLQYAEDDEWSKRLKANSWEVVFAEKSIAIHSHNYTIQQAYKRAYGDCFASAATSAHMVPGPKDFGPRFVLAWLRDCARDWAWCKHAGRITEWPHAVAVRASQRFGKAVGFGRGWRHYHGNTPKKT